MAGFATSLINDHTGKAIARTLQNGDVCWTVGLLRERYDATNRILYYEVFYNGHWYIDEIATDAAYTFTPGVGFNTNGVAQTTLVLSPIQDIN